MFFSVIIPLYNKAPFVEKALHSVATQTFSNYELIIVDDGSKDDSATIAERVIISCWQSLSKSQPVKLIRQANAGVSSARNNGVAVSQGQYICFLDADDWWEPTFLENIALLIQEYPDAGIYGTSYTIVNEHKHKTRIAPIGLDKDFEKGYINYCQVYAKTLCMPLTSISTCIPRHIFEELGGFNPLLKLGEDFDLWIRIALKYKVAFLNKALANYNQDVDVKQRATQHLHNPKQHMLWNLSYLEPFEKTNADYKLLIDKLRAHSLLPYYISKKYHNDATNELDKIDWTRLPITYKKTYQKPIWFLRLKQQLLKFGSETKQQIFKTMDAKNFLK